MNQKIKYFFPICTLLFGVMAHSQQPQKAEKDFTNLLTDIAAYTWKTPKNDFNEHDSIVVIKPYEIKKNILSVTQQNKINDTMYTIKMEVPINKIKNVYVDIYTVLNFFDDDGTIYKTNINNGNKTEVLKTQDWNVGIPFYLGEERTAELQKLLEELLKFYKE